MKRIVILGSGGHAHVIADIIRAEGNSVVAFLDDDLSQPDCGGKLSDYVKYIDCEFIIGIGDENVREELSHLDLKWHKAIHPSAIISESAKINEGTVIMANAIVNCRTVIGKHSIINSGSVIEHDNIIGEYVHISPKVALGGNVSIGDKTWVGIGSTIINNISVCSNVMIGAGAVVVKDIKKPGTYLGIPASPQKN